LCIEDNPDNLKLIEHIFISLLGGIRLLSASNAEEGVQLAAKQLPDLILMDIDLPGMDGYEALKVLRNEDKTAVIPVLAISA
ncbi:MAG: response regulator, partial [Gammaproteobacteria bacterium]|nr:response regulator [Gammaproteobacteria bacterium]NIR94033.1 response regulator [Gammaproteobacteria bacterium]